MKTSLGLSVGIFLLTVSNASAATLYVSPASLTPTPPYESWATAATTIQEALDTALPESVVLVTNGTYAGGLTVDKPLTLLSLNGAQFTVIDGGRANRCLSMTNGVKLSGFTLTNGRAESGGGVWCSSTNSWLTNCIIVGNLATNGGGAYAGTLYNCVLTGNSASGAQYGLAGGALESVLYNCTVTRNSAYQGGGVFYGSLYNCIVYENIALYDTNFSSGQILNFCCTTPIPTNGVGNITNAPLFVDVANGDLRLQSTSPCIDAGNNSFVDANTDLAGEPRISGAAVDIGAYEVQANGPPRITVEPSAQTVYVGSAVSLIASAAGSPSLSWQWHFNGAVVPKATNASLTLGAVTTNDAGTYFAVVTNALGSATSHVAVLTIRDAAPLITVQPADQSVYAGSNVTITAVAEGSLPMSWQWAFNGAPLPNATNATLNLPGVNPSLAGSYVAVVTNFLGSATSHVAVLTVAEGAAPVITLQPLDQTADLGTTVTFKAGAGGSLPLYWQWRRNAVALPDATNSSLTLRDVIAETAGLYSAVVSNVFGYTLTAEARLIVRANPEPGTVRFVWQDSPNPAPPYTNWATAAHLIQDAVDTAFPGDEIVVTNGTYAAGGRTAGKSMVPNRVVVDKPLTVRSVNGPSFTLIEGLQVPGTVNGDSAVRCVHLTSGAILSGFTLTNGATFRTGGDWYTEQSGGGAWCESASAMITKCILVGNSAAYGGGGVYGGTLNNCMLTGNQARGDNGSDNSIGGGATGAVLIYCTVTGNSAGGQYGCGGGASSSSLFGCTVSNNSAVDQGGGVYWACTLTNCTLTANSAGGYGGGARGESAGPCTLYNCVLSRNTAGSGGGASGSQLYSCTLTGNSVDHLAGFAYSGGGVSFCDLRNCILYYNTAVWGTANYDPASTFSNCCTTPLPAGGSGNTSLEPQLATISRLSVNSPCRGAGLAAWATGTDIDGEPWANPPSLGCDEYYAGAVTGPLKVAIAAASTNVAVGSELPFTAVIDGRAAASSWDFGDGVIVSNRPYASHAWTVPGDYMVVLRAYNDSQPAGVSTAVAVHVPAQLIHYVAADSASPVPPFASWTTAATNIQDAVDAATAGDEILVADGLYATGGRPVDANALVNRVAVTKLLSLRSANGPQHTFIQGAKAPDGGNGEGAVRCMYLADGAGLFGFTLTNGATRTTGDLEGEQAGGGVCCESTGAMLSNCIMVANSAVYGGGAYRGTLYNCVLTSNSISGTVYGGGGSYQSSLYNCTLTGNSANSSSGGGVSRGTLYNCIVYYNTALVYSNFDSASTLNYCCTTPTPTNGVGNAPLFSDYARGNLRLQSNSPCINAGNNAYVALSEDFDGNPRIVRGTVDIGAYEFQESQGMGSVLSYAWAEQYGLPTDGSADFIDSDRDGLNNWQEWICGTSPTNPISALRLLSAAPAGSNVTVSWQSVAGISYFLERNDNLTSPFTLVATNIIGQAGTTTYSDTNVSSTGSLFYAVGATAP